MLTYVPPTEREVPTIPNQKPWLLLLLCLVWLLPGLVGHDPWKPAELETAAIVKRFVQEGYWVLPRFADVAYLEFAPLYYWSAAILAWPLSRLGMDIHDAGRLATGLWMALSLWGIGLAGRELYGRRQGRVAVMALIGCVGLIIWGHQLAPQVLLVAAFSWHAFALAHSTRRPLIAGAVLGMAWLVLLLGATWGEFLLALASAVLLLLFRPWRRAVYVTALVTALVISLPLSAVWALWLHQFSPAAFAAWWRFDALGPFGGLGSLQWFHSFGFFISTVTWFAWPVLPLAVWGVWSNRKQWASPAIALPGSMAALTALWLACAGEVRDYSLLPLLVPLALLATAGIDGLRRGAAAALNWFGLMTFGVGTLALWACWFALHVGMPRRLHAWVDGMNPEHVPTMALPGVLFALALSVAWWCVISRKRPLGRLAVTNWACGVTLLWGVLIGLWEPWLDETKSYREVSVSLADAMTALPASCIDVSTAPDAMVVSVDYFTALPLRRVAMTGCRWQIRQGTPSDGDTVVWHGGRRGDQASEMFYLLDKSISSPRP
ncbi:ArnT family glycosyltransferase [Chitiniphilus eburneus]|uniref:Glycosyltransferase RgtA/B/C/D-like domain-containing protein n=1 Tax=Chitiniphilus eburneus TaxID=2571148 RepID=A0A4U0PYY2_9NEIS|nr:hypothetical protein [Chitiniphilus eburneus]TJZ73815.1 hypothetical protein FAZ21_09350 [Chitiniphilus eburneus]